MDTASTEKPWTEEFVLTDRDRYESGHNYSGDPYLVNVSVLSRYMHHSRPKEGLRVEVNS